MNITYLYCKNCKDSIFSFSRHSMIYCKCHRCAIDGGFDYTKTMGQPGDYELIKSDIPSVLGLIRERFEWTKRYNKNDKLLKKPITSKLKDLTTDHIVGILLYFTKQLTLHDDGNSCNMSKDWLIIHEIFLEELKYRKLK